MPNVCRHLIYACSDGRVVGLSERAAPADLDFSGRFLYDALTLFAKRYNTTSLVFRTEVRLLLYPTPPSLLHTAPLTRPPLFRCPRARTAGHQV